MLNKRKLGYELSNAVHDLISQTNFEVLREKEIINIYKHDNSRINMQFSFYIYKDLF